MTASQMLPWLTGSEGPVRRKVRKCVTRLPFQTSRWETNRSMAEALSCAFRRVAAAGTLLANNCTKGVCRHDGTARKTR